MERLIKKKLIDWKNSINRKPLIVYGARQIGKTYSILDFGKDSNMIYNSDSVGAYNIMRIYKKEKGIAITMPIKGLSNPRIINVSV